MIDQFIQQLVEWVSVFPAEGVYAFFFIIAYLENVIPPIPGDILVAFGGYLAAATIISAPLLIMLTTIASVLGFMNMYWFGGKWADVIEKKEKTHWLLRFFDYKYFEKGKSWMNRWGQGVILANRFLAGTRSVISLMAGFYKLSPKWTVINSALSSIIWNSLLVYFGWLVNENWQIIGSYLSTYSQIIIGLLLTAILGRIGWYVYHRKKSNSISKKRK